GLAKEGASGAGSLDEFVKKLTKPRVAWIMVPLEHVEKTVLSVGERMEAGDILIDGGNSYFKDDVRRAKILKARGVSFVDVGTSGGVWGLERGYCMMIGGDAKIVQYLDPIFKTLAPGCGSIPRTPGRDKLGGTAEEGYVYC